MQRIEQTQKISAALTDIDFQIQVCLLAERPFISLRDVPAYLKIFSSCEFFPPVTINFDL